MWWRSLGGGMVVVRLVCEKKNQKEEKKWGREGMHSVCEMGLCAQANVAKLERKPVSTIELIGVRLIAECRNFKQKQK